MWPRFAPIWMSVFYMALFIIRPWERLFPWMAVIRFERVYAILMITVVILSQRAKYKTAFQDLSVLVFLTAIGLSSLFAMQPNLAWTPFYTLVTLVIFYFIMVTVVRSPYELVFMVGSYICTMTVYLLKSQWEFWIHGQHRYTMGVVRLIGIEDTFGGENNLAMSIVVSLPFLLFLWSMRKEFTLTWPKPRRKWYICMMVVYVTVAVTSIIMTNSRSGMLGFVLFVVLVSIRGKGIGKKFCYVIIGLVILGGIWLAMPAENKGRFETIWKPEVGPKSAEASAQGRIEGLLAGITMFQRYPITGVGVGNFVPYRIAHVDGISLQPHNLVGQMLGETGLLGTSAFLLMVFSTLWYCRRTRILSLSVSDPVAGNMGAFTQACRDSIILLFFEGLFGHNLLRFNWLWLAAFSALAWRFSVDASEKFSRNSV